MYSKVFGNFPSNSWGFVCTNWNFIFIFSGETYWTTRLFPDRDGYFHVMSLIVGTCEVVHVQYLYIYFFVVITIHTQFKSKYYVFKLWCFHITCISRLLNISQAFILPYYFSYWWCKNNICMYVSVCVCLALAQATYARAALGDLCVCLHGLH